MNGGMFGGNNNNTGSVVVMENGIQFSDLTIQTTAAGSSTALRSYLAGLTLSTAGASATMTIAAGQATDSTNVVSITLAASINKTTAAWAVATNNGGLDTGTIRASALTATCSFATTVMTCTIAPASGNFAVGQVITGNGLPANTVISSLGTGAGGTGTYNLSTTPGTIAAQTANGLSFYYFYSIRRPDTGIIDVVFSLNSTTPTLPANYTQYRYIGAGITSGASQWMAFTQQDDEFWLSTPLADLNAVAGTTTATLLTTSIPQGKKLKGIFNLTSSNGNATYISDPTNADLAASGGAAPGISGGVLGTVGAGNFATCYTNTTSQIRHREINTNVQLIVTLGWVDTRGKNN